MGERERGGLKIPKDNFLQAMLSKEAFCSSPENSESLGEKDRKKEAAGVVPIRREKLNGRELYIRKKNFCSLSTSHARKRRKKKKEKSGFIVEKRLHQIEVARYIYSEKEEPSWRRRRCGRI